MIMFNNINCIKAEKSSNIEWNYLTDDYVKKIIENKYFVDNLPFNEDIKEMLAESDFLRSKNHNKYLWFADGSVNLEEPSLFKFSVEEYREYGYKIEIIKSLNSFIFTCIENARMLQEQREKYDIQSDNIDILFEEIDELSDRINHMREIRNNIYLKLGKKYNIPDKEINNMILKSDKRLGFDLGKNEKSVYINGLETASVGICTGIIITSVLAFLGNRREKNIMKGSEDARILLEKCLNKIIVSFNKKIEQYIKENNEINDKEKRLIILKRNCYSKISLLILEIQTINNLC